MADLFASLYLPEPDVFPTHMFKPITPDGMPIRTTGVRVLWTLHLDEYGTDRRFGQRLKPCKRLAKGSRELLQEAPFSLRV